MIRKTFAPVVATLLLGLSAQSLAGQFEPLPLKAPEPADNPSTSAKIKLGKQ